jgi:hypothetical protein
LVSRIADALKVEPAALFREGWRLPRALTLPPSPPAGREHVRYLFLHDRKFPAILPGGDSGRRGSFDGLGMSGGDGLRMSGGEGLRTRGGERVHERG